MLAALTACGGDDDGGGGRDGSTPPPTPVPTTLARSEFCARSIAARCQANVRCCTDATARYASVEDCVAVLQPPCESLLGGAAFGEGLVSYDEAAATAGFAMLARAADACEALESDPTAASTILHGTLAENADCTASLMDASYAAACGPGLTCRLGPESPGAPRTASCIRLAGDGERCNLGCASGLYCDLTSLVSVCRPKMDAATECRLPESCRSGACEGGRCTAPRPAWCLTVR